MLDVGKSLFAEFTANVKGTGEPRKLEFKWKSEVHAEIIKYRGRAQHLTGESACSSIPPRDKQSSQLIMRLVIYLRAGLGVSTSRDGAAVRLSLTRMHFRKRCMRVYPVSLNSSRNNGEGRRTLTFVFRVLRNIDRVLKEKSSVLLKN